MYFSLEEAGTKCYNITKLLRLWSWERMDIMKKLFRHAGKSGGVREGADRRKDEWEYDWDGVGEEPGLEADYSIEEGSGDEAYYIEEEEPEPEKIGRAHV